MITLKHLTVERFRLLREINLHFPQRGSILIEGPNEAGKTALLESIYFALDWSQRTLDHSQHRAAGWWRWWRGAASKRRGEQSGHACRGTDHSSYRGQCIHHHRTRAHRWRNPPQLLLHRAKGPESPGRVARPRTRSHHTKTIRVGKTAQPDRAVQAYARR